MSKVIGIIFLVSVVIFSNNIEDGDKYFDKREVSQNINKAIECYKKEYQNTNSCESCAKLIKAIFYKIQFVEKNDDTREKLLDNAKKYGEMGLKKNPDSVEINAWYALSLAVWADEKGGLKALREGVADKIRSCCDIINKKNENYFFGVGYRLLGRLNAKTPKIPFILKWSSKENAEEYLTKAIKISNCAINRQFLSEIKYDLSKKDEALKLAYSVINDNTIYMGIRENKKIKKDMKQMIDKWN